MLVIILGVLLTIVTVIVTNRVVAVRRAVDAISTRTLVGMHIVRYIGFVFLALTAAGKLSPVFGQRAGWGDIVVASLALALVLIALMAGSAPRWALLTWNTLGMLDLLAAVGTAAMVIFRGDAPGMEPLLRLPLIGVPLVAVPLLLATHMTLFRRLASR